MTIKFHGKTFTAKGSVLETVKKHLEKCPKDEVFSSTDIANQCSVSSRLVNEYSDRGLKDYAEKVGATWYYGSRAAIAELRKQLKDA